MKNNDKEIIDLLKQIADSRNWIEPVCVCEREEYIVWKGIEDIRDTARKILKKMSD